MKSLLIWLGLALVVVGSSLLVLPYIPARPAAAAAMAGVPHGALLPWAAAAVLGLGVVLLRRASK